MSDYVPKPGTLEVSETVHDFMSTIEHDPKKGEFDQLKLFFTKNKNEIFKLGFAIGYVNQLEFISVGGEGRNTVAPRGFPMENYRKILNEEAIERKMSIGGLLSAYADAGLRHLQQHLDTGKDVMELLEL
jgi:hypothetical protein